MKLDVWSSTLGILVALAPLGIMQQAIAMPLTEPVSEETASIEEQPDAVAQSQDISPEGMPGEVPAPSSQALDTKMATLLDPQPGPITTTLPPDAGVDADTAVQPAPAGASDPVLETGQFLYEADALMGAVTSVTDFSDVEPTDWAYEALQFLIEEYSCLTGYPDQTFRGDRGMSRFEFAAALAACLESFIETSIPLADLPAIQRLQEEFATELAMLRDRVDSLEDRTAILEAQQFSTTTVLRGNAFFNLTQAFISDDILAERNLSNPDVPFIPPTRDANNRPTRVERDQPQVTLSYLTWLNLSTSFTGRDNLAIQLAVGNGSSPANTLVSSGYFNSWGVPFTDQTGAPNANEFVVRELFYSFPVGDNIQIDVGPRVNYYRYFDGNQFTFFLTGAGSFNSSGSTLLNAVDRGAGAVIQWRIIDPLEFTVGYLGENSEFLNASIFNSATDSSRGLFNGSNTISTQLEYSPTSDLNLRLIYARSSLEPYNGYIGGAVGEPLPYGFADDGFGGTLNTGGADTFVANFDWRITDWIGIFGRYSYGRLDINPVNDARDGGEIRVQSFQVGLGFPDLGKRGALGVISFLVPHDYLEGRRFLLSGAGDGGTQYELEISYRYPLTDNISLVPAFYTIWNANNFEENPAVFVGNLRMQFSF